MTEVNFTKGGNVKNRIIKNSHVKKMALLASGIGLVMVAEVAGASAAATSLGAMASGITKSFVKIGELISGASYVAGLGFFIGAIMKFKAHKDNPTQITVGTPVALVFVAAALLFMPSLMKIAGGSAGLVTSAGPGGISKIS